MRYGAAAVLLFALAGCAELKVVGTRAIEEMTANDVVPVASAAPATGRQLTGGAESAAGLLSALLETGGRTGHGQDEPRINVYAESKSELPGKWGNGRLNYVRK